MSRRTSAASTKDASRATASPPDNSPSAARVARTNMASSRAAGNATPGRRASNVAESASGPAKVKRLGTTPRASLTASANKSENSVSFLGESAP